MSNSKGVNRKYKDRLFTFIFGNSENKAWTLSLYNAVNGSDYTNPDDIILNTIDNVVYMGMKNDVSFLMGDMMNFYEQQSTFNPNMPMRFLIYAGMVYSKYIEGDNGYHRFSKQQQKAPTPKCVCFYNGTDSKQDRIILSLSDSFDKDSQPDIEVKVTMININYGHNKDLLNACKPLNEYSWFIDKVRNSKASVFEEAIDIALTEMPDDFIIKSFLIANRAEVKRMCITEYDESRTLAEQREEGRIEGILNTLVSLVKDNIITLSDAAQRANMTVTEFELKTGLKA
ncbi:MAG: hypothetical protein K2J32_07800 [Ruminococcus sp.]|nr:hypothetical protein [Ruminococcus sp.]